MSSEKDGLDDLDLDRANFDHGSTAGKGTPASGDGAPASGDGAPASGDGAPASGDGASEPTVTENRETNSAEAVPRVATKPSCQACQSPIEHEYFTLGDHTFCSKCGQAFAQQLSRGPAGALPRALMFGLGGGALGSALYYGVSAISGYELGIIAIVVGILVGKGIRKGAGLHQHWVYPALGIALTYLAIVSTYVPQVLEAFTADAGAATDRVYSVDSLSGSTTGTQILLAFLFSLVVPFLMLAQFEIWGPIILGIGLWEGWRYARGTRLELKGPFRREG